MNIETDEINLETNKIAITLQYPDGTAAPFVSAAGKGELAEKIIEIAKNNNVLIREDKNLAELLSNVKIGELIPIETYEAVASIFVFLKIFGRKYYE